MRLIVAEEASELPPVKVEVYEWHAFHSNVPLASCEIPLSVLADGPTYSDTFQLQGSKGPMAEASLSVTQNAHRGAAPRHPRTTHRPARDHYADPATPYRVIQ